LPAADVAPAVTRSITILRPPSLSVPSGESSSLPSSPAGAPDSPFAAGGPPPRSHRKHASVSWPPLSQQETKSRLFFLIRNSVV
jgi:hypothetical protein